MDRLSLEFPLQWEYKIIATRSEACYGDMCTAISAHGCAQLPEAGNLSKNGKYITYTLCLQIESREHLDALTQALTSCPGVKYIL